MINEKNMDMKETISNIYADKNFLNNCTIEIINSCIFKCDHCYMPNAKQNRMDIETYKQILKELSDIGCIWILLTGGECLMHPNFKEMYKLAKDMGFFVSINTNGYFINNELIELFKKYKPYTIEISLYGYNEETYYAFTHVPNAYEKIDHNIKELLKNNIHVSLKTVLTKKNYNYLFQLQEYANHLNIPFRYDYVLFPKLNENKNTENKERLTSKEIINILKKDIEAKKHFTNKIATMLNESKPSKFIFECSGGEDAIYIDSFGNIHMCVVMINDNYNIKNYSIKEALEQFKKLKCTKLNDNSNCKYCVKKSLCRYCPARFKLETGNYEKEAKWYCDTADAILEEFNPQKTLTQSTLTDKTLTEMFHIISINRNESPNNKEIYKIWKTNIINNKNLKTCTLKNNNIYAYIQYIKESNEYCICEIEIDKKHQKDHITFRKLIELFIINANINQNSIIYGNINPNNKHSKEVFTSIGFIHTKKNRYEITGKDLLNWYHKN